MAKEVLKNVAIYFGQYDLASQINSLDLGLSVNEVDVTNFASGGWKELLAGIKEAGWQFDGFMDLDPVTGEPDATLFNQLGVAGGSGYPVTVVKNRPAADGDVAYFMRAANFKHHFGARIGEAAALNLMLKNDSPTVRGLVLEQALTVPRTGTGTSAAQQSGAVLSSQYLYVAVHVLAVAGTLPTLDIVIQRDTVGFPTPLTAITVPQITAAGSYFGRLAGPITDDYTRVSATVGGSGGPSFTYLVAIGVGS